MKRLVQFLALVAASATLLSNQSFAQHYTYTVDGTVNNVQIPLGIWSGVQVGDPVKLTVSGYFVPFDCLGSGKETYLSASLNAEVEIAGIASSEDLVSGRIDVWNDVNQDGFPGTCGDSFEISGSAAADYEWFGLVLHDSPASGCSDTFSSCSLPLSVDPSDFGFFKSIAIVFDGPTSSLIEADFNSIGVVVTMTDFCNGDGGSGAGCTDCPCGNNAAPGTVGGCLNSVGSSARLLPTGSPSISLPLGSSEDLRFGLTGAPPSVLSILFSGDAAAPVNMANPCFGQNSGTTAIAFDGLRCAVGNVRRSGARVADGLGNIGDTNNAWGGANQPAAGIGVALGAAAGETRYFQAVNRDNSQLVCGRGLNTSQAVEVTFAP